MAGPSDNEEHVMVARVLFSMLLVSFTFQDTYPEKLGPNSTENRVIRLVEVSPFFFPGPFLPDPLLPGFLLLPLGFPPLPHSPPPLQGCHGAGRCGHLCGPRHQEAGCPRGH